MKRVLGCLLMLVLVTGLTLGGFQADAAPNKALKVALLLNGNLGDKSFFDSANSGLQRIKKELGVTTKVVEIGPDQTKWEPSLADISDENWDIVIVGTWQMAEILQKIAVQHPEKKFILFDSSVDYSKGKFSNVYSIEYKQNEGSYLAGVLAAKVSKSNMPLANKEKSIGFVGGMDIPVINDFLVGYIEGAKHEDPNIKVATSYIGDFFNSAKGKEMALALYNQKADIVFSVASQAGLGALDAAKSEKKYVIGVDSDQSLLFKDSDPDKAKLILTSVLKRVDNSLYRAIKLYQQKQLKWGQAESLGLKEGAVGIAKNEFYKKNVPAQFQKDIDALEKQIISGQIKVDSALGMSTSKLNEIRNSVKP